MDDVVSDSLKSKARNCITQVKASHETMKSINSPIMVLNIY